MLYLTNAILNKVEAQNIINQAMMSDKWTDGNLTATYETQDYKKNLQLSSRDLPNETDYIKKVIMGNESVSLNCFPRHVHNVLFTRTGAGMYYKPHSDNPFIESGRRDLSFTLFLEDKGAYDGGELILDIPPEVKNIKLDQGQAIFYPTTYIHEVKPVTNGERIVCVGWIESVIPEPEDREILSTLTQSLEHIDNKVARLKVQNAYFRMYKRFSK